MKIAFWVNTFPPRYESFIINQISEMVERGYSVDIYACNKGPRSHLVPPSLLLKLQSHIYYRSAVPSSRWAKSLSFIHSFLKMGITNSLIASRIITGRKEFGRLRLLLEAQLFLSAKQYDIIHCQFMRLGAMAVYFRSLGIIQGKIITSVRGGNDLLQIPEGDIPLYELLFEQGDLFFPVTNDLANRIESRGCPSNKIHVHRSGISIGDIQKIKESHSISSSHSKIISVARLDENKGICVALRAFSKVLPSNKQCHYTIIGEGPERSRLESLADELGIFSSVTFLGWMNQEDAWKEMAQSDVFVLPCHTGINGNYEGLPNVLKEAMLLKLPVVSTHHAGIPELIEEGVSGYLVPERDIDTLANRINHLLDNPELRQQMGEAGHQHVVSTYDSVTLNIELTKLYEKVLKPQGEVCASL